MDRKKNFSELNRIEEKYVVDKTQALVIKRIAEKHLKAAYIDPDIEYTLIKSTYLDSKELGFYRQHLDQKDRRLKLRIRQYGPDGNWKADETYLEIKEKDDGETSKTRIQLDPNAIKALNNGREITVTEELFALNKKDHTKKHFMDFLFRVNNLIRAYKLKPMVTVLYKRYAYEDARVRITIDSNITYKTEGNMSMFQALKLDNLIDWDAAKKYGDKYNTNTNAVVEIKYEKSDKDQPNWVDDMLKELDLESEKFSKYAWSMYKLLAKLLVN